jgi:hypothetical protein
MGVNASLRGFARPQKCQLPVLSVSAGSPHVDFTTFMSAERDDSSRGLPFLQPKAIDYTAWLTT